MQFDIWPFLMVTRRALQGRGLLTSLIQVLTVNKKKNEI